ncbi:hypothetical protein AALG83_06305 [Christensenellaceae bacterium 44-20]
MSEQVNIEQIMEEIRREIREKGISLDIPEFSGASEKPVAEIAPFDMNEFMQNVVAVERSYQVERYAPIVGNPIVKLVKRVVRKMINFIIAPIVEDQNAFNAAAAKTIFSLQSYISELEKRMKELESAKEQGERK